MCVFVTCITLSNLIDFPYCSLRFLGLASLHIELLHPHNCINPKLNLRIASSIFNLFPSLIILHLTLYFVVANPWSSSTIMKRNCSLLKGRNVILQLTFLPSLTSLVCVKCISSMQYKHIIVWHEHFHTLYITPLL